jgi:hypothetical protein
MPSLRWRRGLGWLMNALGVPGLMRAARCEQRLGIPVEVIVGKMFTVIQVREVKVFFDRVTGRFDGVTLHDSGCDNSPAGTA